jgi:hypothetical protein
MVNCQLLYNKGTTKKHLRQILAGFFELERQGVLNVQFTRCNWNSRRVGLKIWDTEGATAYLLKVIVDGERHIIYDVSDGVHTDFIKSVVAPNCDVLFKRSYTPALSAAVGSSPVVLPLGLNYEVTSASNRMDRIFYSTRAALIYYLKSSKFLASLFNVEHTASLYIDRFEALPNASASPRILFLARLWDPMVARTADDRIAKERINETRIKCIRACAKEFKDRFTGGLRDDDFSRKRCPDLISPPSVTNKIAFQDQIKQSEICIATTGLNESIGWKFGEYVAASRAIVTEPLRYVVPGDLKSGRNYLEFSSEEQLLQAVYSLYDDEYRRRAMMEANRDYYKWFLRPERLVSNSLIALEQLQTANPIQQPRSA